MTDYLAHRGMRGEGVRRLIEQGAIELDADQGATSARGQEKDQREAQRLAAEYLKARDFATVAGSRSCSRA